MKVTATFLAFLWLAFVGGVVLAPWPLYMLFGLLASLASFACAGALVLVLEPRNVKEN